MAKLFNSVLFLLCVLSIPNNADAQTTDNEKQTDRITRKVVAYMNANLPDSIYTFAGEEMKKKVNQQFWLSVYQNNFYPLLPFTEVLFISRTDSISKYKLQGKTPLTLFISLDKAGKVKTFLFQPWEEEAGLVKMTDTQQKTDVLARKILGLMQRKQADSIYLYAGISFKSQLDAKTFKSISENNLFPLGPFSNALFLDSRNGINRYKLNQYQFVIGIDKEGKFSTLAVQPFQQLAKKTVPALSDNLMKTQLDSLVNRYLSGYIQTQGHVGLSAAIHIKGKDYYYNYGETRQGNAQLPGNHTLYDIGSITKTFTTTLLAIAVGQGKVNLSTSIVKFLPDSVASNSDLKGITFQHLSNHTSGFPRLAENHQIVQTDVNQPYANYGIKEMFSYLKNYRAARKPEAKYEYSNFGVGLLGILLERMYKQPYKTLIQKYITNPGKMTETVLTADLEDARFAQGYNERNLAVPTWTFQAIEAAGAIKSSTTDLLKYGKFQLSSNHSVLTPAFNLTHKVTHSSGSDIIGLGWVYLRENPKVMYHLGGTSGFKSSLAIDKDKEIVVAVLSNNSSSGDALGLRLLKALQTVSK